MKFNKVMKMAAVFPTVSIIALPAMGQGILDKLDSTMTCQVISSGGSINFQVGRNEDGSLSLVQDGMPFPVPIVEGTEPGQYEVSDDGNTYAILMDPSIGYYYIFDFQEKTARVYGLNGAMDASGRCN